MRSTGTCTTLIRALAVTALGLGVALGSAARAENRRWDPLRLKRHWKKPHPEIREKKKDWKKIESLKCRISSLKEGLGPASAEVRERKEVMKGVQDDLRKVRKQHERVEKQSRELMARIDEKSGSEPVFPVARKLSALEGVVRDQEQARVRKALEKDKAYAEAIAETEALEQRLAALRKDPKADGKKVVACVEELAARKKRLAKLEQEAIVADEAAREATRKADAAEDLLAELQRKAEGTLRRTPEWKELMAAQKERDAAKKAVSEAVKREANALNAYRKAVHRYEEKRRSLRNAERELAAAE